MTIRDFQKQKVFTALDSLQLPGLNSPKIKELTSAITNTSSWIRSWQNLSTLQQIDDLVIDLQAISKTAVNIPTNRIQLGSWHSCSALYNHWGRLINDPTVAVVFVPRTRTHSQLDTTDIHVIHAMTHLLPTLILADWEPRHGKMFVCYFRTLCHDLLSHTRYEVMDQALTIHGVSWGLTTKSDLRAKKEQTERKWQRKEEAMKENLTIIHRKLNNDR